MHSFVRVNRHTEVRNISYVSRQPLLQNPLFFFYFFDFVFDFLFIYFFSEVTVYMTFGVFGVSIGNHLGVQEIAFMQHLTDTPIF